MRVAHALGRFVRPVNRGPAPGDAGACELCAAPLDGRHAHVVELRGRAVRCACPACAVLFRDGSSDRFRTVPERVLVDPELRLTDADWAALEIPVGLAFLFRSSAAGRWLAVYPGAAGAITSELPLEAWERLAGRTGLAAAALPDVEALLVRGRPGGGPLEVLLVPIDRCYELAGRLRRVWRGFEGGAEARRELDAFFAGLQARARPVSARGGGRR